MLAGMMKEKRRKRNFLRLWMLTANCQQLQYIAFNCLPANIRNGTEAAPPAELELLAYTTATATQDLSCLCDLHHSSRQCRILNPLSEARDRTPILMDTSLIGFCFPTMGTSSPFFFFFFFK